MLRAVSAVPVIVATARDDEAEIVRVARRRRRRLRGQAVRRRPSSTRGSGRCCAAARDRRRTDPAVVVGGLRIDPRARQATLDGAPLDLTPREFDLLHYLAARPGAGGHQAGAADRGVAAARTAARTRPSTCTCPGCAASSARPRSSPATCTPCAGSGSGSRRPGSAG